MRAPITHVLGARPNFMKAAPVIRALGALGHTQRIVHTGQHYDERMSEVFFVQLSLPRPDVNLGVGSGSHATQTAEVLTGMEREFTENSPALAVVYGDVNSTIGAALAGAKLGVPMAHVEAGLRSFDPAMPEERNRIAVDQMAALLLCPDEHSAAQLESEGVRGRREVVGDVMRDALDLFVPIADRLAQQRQQPYALLTIHRASNTEPDRLRRLISELNGTGWTFVFPVHPRTRHVLDENGIRLSPDIEAIDPQGYLELLALLRGATRVVTDSGGMQKEAYWLGIPCVTLRKGTEWVDTVASGANTLVDPDDPSSLGYVLTHAEFPADAPQLYGDGHASERIATALYANQP